MKRKRPLKALRRELDSVFSKRIRQRDSFPGAGDWGKCTTCGKAAVLEAGHFIPRQHLATRWDERNVHGQCSYCNRWLHGNLINYTLFMQKKYGQPVIDELMELKRTTVRFRRDDYERMIERFS